MALFAALDLEQSRSGPPSSTSRVILVCLGLSRTVLVSGGPGLSWSRVVLVSGGLGGARHMIVFNGLQLYVVVFRGHVWELSGLGWCGGAGGGWGFWVGSVCGSGGVGLEGVWDRFLSVCLRLRKL